ncbi:hypothetical protein [Terrabacter terrigena]|uniref:HNH endonuclease n=1 Tax=Terrabacter terrigena TaxID=574718 RepID=A0ABW3MXS0_9MICO
MPWMKSGDTAASYPALLAVDELPTAEDWSVNEVAGFVYRLGLHSAAHMTDYLIGYGDVKLMSPTRFELLVEQACSTGLMRLVSGEGRGRRWQIVEDDEFMHIRKKAAVQWDRQRDSDRRNKDLTMPVRLRDGDACRYCNQVVSWSDHRSGRAGTYDHREPGQAATVETYVVACKQCNSARLNDEHADTKHPLLPVPTVPYYTAKTRSVLEAYFGPEKVAARLGEPTDPARAPQAAVRPEQAPAGTTTPSARREARSAAQDASGRPATEPGSGTDPGSDPDRTPVTRSGDRVGSGRVGPGQVRSGREGTGRDGSPSRSRSRRRGRRGKPPQPREGT